MDEPLRLRKRKTIINKILLIMTHPRDRKENKDQWFIAEIFMEANGEASTPASYATWMMAILVAAFPPNFRAYTSPVSVYIVFSACESVVWTCKRLTHLQRCAKPGEMLNHNKNWERRCRSMGGIGYCLDDGSYDYYLWSSSNDRSHRCKGGPYLSKIEFLQNTNIDDTAWYYTYGLIKR